MLTFEQLLTLKADLGHCEQVHIQPCYCGSKAAPKLLETCEALFKEKRFNEISAKPGVVIGVKCFPKNP